MIEYNTEQEKTQQDALKEQQQEPQISNGLFVTDFKTLSVNSWNILKELK